LIANESGNYSKKASQSALIGIRVDLNTGFSFAESRASQNSTANWPFWSFMVFISITCNVTVTHC